MAEAPEDTNEKEKHIMISYQWNSQERMSQLRDKLKEEGYNVWMDIDKMAGNILSAMAQAVENAEVVLMCVSKDYQKSENCQSEAEYARLQKKTIIPLKIDDHKPSDWLGMIMGMKLYYEVSTDDVLHQNFPKLIREIGDKGRITVKRRWTPPCVKEGSKALKCSICLQRFKTPKSLPCMHTFCLDCLIRLAAIGTTSNISCPVCRRQFPIPAGGVGQFPTNFIVKELVEEEALKHQQVGQGGREFSCTCCPVGKQTRVVAKCQTCKHYICNFGLEAHRVEADLLDHSVLFLENQSEAVTESTAEMDVQHGTKISGWDLFDEMYDKEHSLNLFKYWIQQHGESDWQTEMASRYLACLTELEKNIDLVGEQTLARRYQQVARVLKQAGQYDNALKLIEKALEMEKKELGERPEKMADLNYLAADLHKEIVNSITSIEARDPRLVQKQIKFARSALKLRKTLQGDDNKFEMGKVLRLLSAALMAWAECGGDSLLTAANAKIEAEELIEESIVIFEQVGAAGNTAMSVANKAIFMERASEAQEQLFRQALELCLKAYGESSVLSGRLHWNMFVLYEDREDYQEAHQWLVKCQEIREKIYGRQHPQTKQVYEKLKAYSAIITT